MKIAAIDIGSNSIKLLVVDALASDSFVVLAREKEVVRLGHNTLREGHLSPDAIKRAADTIKRFRAIAAACGVVQTIAIATASVREVNNSAEFIKEVEERTGVRVEIISGIEEAHLIGLAVAQECASTCTSLLNIDIGGGSTEISLMQDGEPVRLYSIPLGAVGLTERFITSDPPKRKEIRALRDAVRGVREQPCVGLQRMNWQQTTGTSGTILAIGEALRLRLPMEATRSDQEVQPAGCEIALNQLERFNECISALSLAKRRRLPGISAQRAEIIVAGAQILEAFMQGLGIKVLRTCEWALREGLIIDRLRHLKSASLSTVPQTVDQKLRGVQAIGQRFNYAEAHAHQVTKLARKIFDDLTSLYNFTPHQRTLLSAAAMLHDVGYFIAYEAHHKHSLYLIKNSELKGFSEAERDVIANIARYHRGALPKERHTDFAALNQSDQETVNRLSAILRIADALDRNHDGRVLEVGCVHERKVLHVEIRSAQDCEREMLAAEQKGDLFEQVFNSRLAFSAPALIKRV